MKPELEPADPCLLGEWIREEAFNLEKIFSGEPRLDFIAWKRRRDERSRTVNGGEA